MNRAPQVRYALSDLPGFLPWLVRYYLASSPERALHSAMAELPLIRRSLIEHEALIAEAGVPELLRRTGWIKLFRSDATLANAVRDLDRARQYGVEGEVLDAKAIAAREPNLTGDFAGADLLAGARLRSRSRRTGQSLCGAVHAQGRTLLRGRCANARTGRRRMARGRTRRRHDRARCRGGARTMVRPGVSPARIFDSAQRQARLSSASGAARQCGAASSRARFRSGLSAGADEPRHPPHHRRRVCAPRCAADADPA